MSNDLLDPTFHLHMRTEEWRTSNPGAANFIELASIDTAIFYCHFIEEIVQICGQVRREKVWFRLPTIQDYHHDDADGSKSPKQAGKGAAKRGRNPTRAPMGSPGNGHLRTPNPARDPDDMGARMRRAKVENAVAGEVARVRAFVKETQRTADHLVLGVELVEEGSDAPIGRARDAGLWGVPVDEEETRRVREVSDACRAYCPGLLLGQR
jgi:hypothetical protein